MRPIPPPPAPSDAALPGERSVRERVVDLERRGGHDGRRVVDALRNADAESVAAASGLPLAHVHGTATFYADLRPGPARSRCVGIGCLVAAGGQLEPAGDPPARPVHCLGCCYAGPAALHDDELVCGPAFGQPAPTIPWRVEAPAAVVLAGLTGDGPAPGAALAHADGDGARVLDEVARSGLAGRGGAAFPVARKWQAARDAPTDGPRYLVANGDEGDAGSFADRLLMERDPDRVLAGMALAALACGASEGILYVRSEYPAAHAAMVAAVRRARAAGRLGPTFDVTVVEGAGSYVAGEETALLHAVEGLRGTAAIRPPYPAQSGLLGRPTVVNNVETLAAVPWIVVHGGDAYRRLGVPDATGTKLVCFNERFARPGVVEVPFGITLRALVEEIGGGLRDGRTLRALQVGGPLGGFLAPDELDVPFTPAALHAAGVELGHGGLVAIDERVRPEELLVHLWDFGASESCGACSPCRVGTTRGLELARQLARDGPSPALVAAHARVLELMSRASACGFGLGLAPAIRSLVGVYAAEFACG